ncbi:cytochrome P450 [Lentinula edodes]|nr:cytochrome P450 [Lentinula edodes]
MSFAVFLRLDEIARYKIKTYLELSHTQIRLWRNTSMHKVHGVALIRVRRTVLSQIPEQIHSHFVSPKIESYVDSHCQISDSIYGMKHLERHPVKLSGVIFAIKSGFRGLKHLKSLLTDITDWLKNMAQYIYQLNLLGRKVIFVSSYTLMNELSDDSRFQKSVGGALKETRNLIHDGIFTMEYSRWNIHDGIFTNRIAATPVMVQAFDGESSWITARHRLLIPAFGTYFTFSSAQDMREICDQMICKWDGYYSSMIHVIQAGFIRKCEFIKISFVKFRQKGKPPLDNPNVYQHYRWQASTRHREDEEDSSFYFQVLQYRKVNPIDRKDMLNVMLNGRDPRTGARMSDNSIIDNLLTFLIAGTMSFALYYLLKHPLVMKTHSILDDQPSQLGDSTRMEYLHVIRETMRLQPTATIRAVYPLEDTAISGDGKYFIVKDTPIALQIWDLHRDFSVWDLDTALLPATSEGFYPNYHIVSNHFRSLLSNVIHWFWMFWIHWVYGYTRSESEAEGKQLAAEDSFQIPDDVYQTRVRNLGLLYLVIPIICDKSSNAWHALIPTLDVLIEAVGGTANLQFSPPPFVNPSSP